MPPKPRVLIAISHRQGNCHIALLRSIMQLDTASIEVAFVDSTHTSELINRNILVEKFLSHPVQPTHVLLLDANVGLQPNTIRSLLQADKDIVCALGVESGTNRLLPVNVGATPYKPKPVHYDWCNPPAAGQPHWILRNDMKSKVVPVDVGGLGCFLARRAVFEKTPYPWFFDEFNPEAITHTRDSVLEDDVAFFLKAKKFGFVAHVHTGVRFQRWTGSIASPPFWEVP